MIINSIVAHYLSTFLFVIRLTLSYTINNLFTSLSDATRDFIGHTEFNQLVKSSTEFNNKELDEKISEILDIIIKVGIIVIIIIIKE